MSNWSTLLMLSVGNTGYPRVSASLCGMLSLQSKPCWWFEGVGSRPNEQGLGKGDRELEDDLLQDHFLFCGEQLSLKAVNRAWRSTDEKNNNCDWWCQNVCIWEVGTWRSFRTLKQCIPSGWSCWSFLSQRSGLSNTQYSTINYICQTRKEPRTVTTAHVTHFSLFLFIHNKNFINSNTQEVSFILLQKKPPISILERYERE